MNEIAENETEALKAIYGLDYSSRTQLIKVAWSAPKEELIHKLQLYPRDSLKSKVSVELEFKFGPNYPLEVPHLRLTNPIGLGSNFKTLEKELAAIAQTFIGQEMIYDICLYLQEFIQDHNEINDSLSSGYTNMKLQKEIDTQNKAKLEMENRQKELEIKRERSNLLAEKVSLEIERKQTMLKDERSKRVLKTEPEQDFVPTLAQAIVSPFRTGHNPSIQQAWFADRNECFIIETFECCLPDENSLTILWNSLDSRLKVLSKARHPNFVSILDYDLIASKGVLYLKVLTANVKKLCANDIFKLGCNLTLNSGKTMVSGFISLFDYFDRLGVPLGIADLENVWFDLQMNLVLSSTCCLPEFTSGSTTSFEPWEYPGSSESHDHEKMLWKLGCVTLALFNGSRAQSFRDPVECAQNTFENAELVAFIKILSDPEVASETDFEELFQHPFLTIKEDQSSLFVPKKSEPTVEIPYRVHSEVNSSRYLNDFEELEFLGQGGFGSVVKARNVIDGRFYAIKKIKLNPMDTKRLLREVQTISRLQSEYIVRYYQAWFEDTDGISESEEDDESFTSDYTSDESDEEGDWLSSGLSLELRKTNSLRIMRRSDSTNGSESNAFTKVLYIQMEYCKNNTLRDVIENGVDVDVAWKYFRQLLEGLGHLHAQGIIHRDLKPTNIFLDESGKIKIGDFGLATVKRDAGSGSLLGSMEFGVSKSGLDLSSQVGTPVYTAPEIAVSNRYNSKVDMYSLGIVFFELLYKMNTGMQRHLVLQELRTPSIIFPKDFKFEAYANQVTIIKNLLNHVPRERFSCRQLLSSPLVPASVENEYISEELLRVVRQRNPLYFSRIMEALHNQIMDTHKDFAYDFNSNVGHFDPFMARIYALTHLNTLRVFINHGAVCIDSPLILPKTETFLQLYNAKKPVEYVDKNGDVVQLPYDLTVPFARKLSQNTEELTLPLKRFSLQKIYRKNLTGGQPFEIKECDFDIVYEHEDGLMTPESEAINIVFEILQAGDQKINVNEYNIGVNSMKNLKNLFGIVGVPLSLRKATLEILSQLHKPMKWVQVKGNLLKLGLASEIVEKLSNFDYTTEIESHSSSLDSCRDPETLKQLKTLTLNLRSLGIKNKVLFDPLLVFNPTVFEKGFVFQISKSRSSKLDVIAAGGRYDSLLSKFRSPFSSKSEELRAVGVSVAFSKLLSILAEHPSIKQEETKQITASCKKADVLVTFMGNKEVILPHQLSIVSELWRAGISAELSYEDDLTLQERSNFRFDYKYAVIVKTKGADSYIVKVKDLASKTEIEVQRSTLVKYLSDGNSKSHGTESTPMTQVPIIVPQNQKKSKQRVHQMIITEKAIHATLESFKSAPIIAVELSTSDIESFQINWNLNETLFKEKYQKSHASSEREYLLVVKRLLVKTQKNGSYLVWIYSNLDSKVIPLVLS